MHGALERRVCASPRVAPAPAATAIDNNETSARHLLLANADRHPPSRLAGCQTHPHGPNPHTHAARALPTNVRGGVAVDGDGPGRDVPGVVALAVRRAVAVVRHRVEVLGREAARHDHAPHAAEAARLLDRSVSDVMNQTMQSVADMAERYQATCLLKGPGTVMGDQRSQAICGHGNPGMATAGMGDVLAGLAGSLIAQHSDDMAGAFCAAILLHSAAGDLAAQEIGERGITASAVIPRVAALLQELPSVTG